MKKRILSLFLSLTCLGVLSASAAAADTVHGIPSSYWEDLTAEEAYITSLAQRKGISYDEAAKLEAEENAQILRKPDEGIAYALAEKLAYTISDGSQYHQKVYIFAQLKYVYSTITGTPLSLEGIEAPYTFLPEVDPDEIEFDHGGFTITKYNNQEGTVAVTGSYTYYQKGISVGVDIDILSVSRDFFGCTIRTYPLGLRATFKLSDCPRKS